MTTPLFDPAIITAGSSLIAVIVIAAALLRAWQGWLDLKRHELERAPEEKRPDHGLALGTARIEMADLKERIRKLEAIASGVEL